MEDFFTFYTNIPKDKTFKLFDKFHIGSMAVIAGIIYILLNAMRHMTERNIWLLIKGAAIMLPALEITRVVWFYRSGITHLVNLLPFHLCAMQVFIVPLAVFTDIPVVKEFMYCSALLGGISGISFVVGIAGSYPLFHYQTLETLTYHAILIFVPLAMIMHTGFVPDIGNFPLMVLAFVVVCSLVGIFDYKYKQNYIFLREPPVGTPLVWVFDRFGVVIYYLVCLSLAVVVAYIMFLPFI